MKKPKQIVLGLSLVFLFSVAPLLFAHGKTGRLPPRHPSFEDDGDTATLVRALKETIDRLKKIPRDRAFSLDHRRLTTLDLLETLTLFQSLVETRGIKRDFHKAILRHFDLVRVGAKDVVFTGYYEPILEARSGSQGDFLFPIYRRPDDLVVAEAKDSMPGGPQKAVGRLSDGKIVPYYTRAEIEKNKPLESKELEIAWVRDRVALFFLHVQGSGILQFEDGERRRIHYDGSNGHPYRSVGKHLRDTGKIAPEGISLQRIRSYLEEHPEEVEPVLQHNESFIFFRVIESGPVGSLGVRLSGGRSIAIDPQLFPLGGVAYMVTKKPDFHPRSGKIVYEPLRRFVLAHDTGSAIQGPARADIFFGTGKEAEEIAGRMMERGSLHFLVKKEITRKKRAGTSRR